LADYQSRLDVQLIHTIFNDHADRNYDEAKSVLDMIVNDLPPQEEEEERKSNHN
jgi:hypothetical protein